MRAEAILTSLRGELIADFLGACVLPDDGFVHGLARFAIPDDGGFSLVCYTDGRDIGGRSTRLLHRVTRNRRYGRPDRLGVVLDPPGLRIDLRELLLIASNDAGVVIVDDGAAAARALVDGKQVLSFHDSLGLTLNKGCLIRIRCPASSGHGCCS